MAVIGLYVVTRTVGVPFLGPDAGEVEAVGTLDLPTKAAEFLAVVPLVLLHWEAARDPGWMRCIYV